MPILLTLVGLLALIGLIAILRLDTFISFVLVSIGLGLASGMPVADVSASIRKGIGGTLGDLVLIIGFGAMLGRIVADSGAARRITQVLLGWFGPRYIRWGLALAGFIIGIPLFYNAGFIIVAPLIFTIAASSRLPLLTVAIPMLSALSVAHGYLPPHPSPVAIAAQLHADLGKTLLLGICIAIPAIILAGPIFGKTLGRFNPQPDKSVFNLDEVPTTNLPSAGVSFFVALLPVLLLTLVEPLRGQTQPGSWQYGVLSLLAEAYVGMLLSVLVAIGLLGIGRGQSMETVTKQLEGAIKSVAPVLLVIAGAGGLKQIFQDAHVSDYIGLQLRGLPVSPLILGWGMAAVIRVCVGSATVAGLTTVGIILPLITASGVKPELMVLAIGAGSLALSHVNDGGFWLFKQYFNLSIADTLRTWTVMETIVSVVGLAGVLVLDMLV